MDIKAKSNFKIKKIKGWQKPSLYLMVFLFLYSCKVGQDFKCDRCDADDEDVLFQIDNEDDEQYPSCPEKAYYSYFAGDYGNLCNYYDGIQIGAFKAPIVMTIVEIVEKEMSGAGGNIVNQSVFAGSIPLTEEYREANNFVDENYKAALYVHNFGKIKNKTDFYGKEIIIDEKAGFSMSIDSNVVCMSITSYRLSGFKLIAGTITGLGSVNFTEVPLNLSESFPEFEIIIGSADNNKICKKQVDSSTRESFFDFLYFPDIAVECKKNNETLSMKEGVEYLFCGFKFFITESVAVAKGIDDDGSVGYSGKSSFFTMYIVNEEILEK